MGDGAGRSCSGVRDVSATMSIDITLRRFFRPTREDEWLKELRRSEARYWKYGGTSDVISPEWDAELNALLDDHGVTPSGSTIYALIGNRYVWASNWPSPCYGALYIPDPPEPKLPGDDAQKWTFAHARTRVRFRLAIEAARAERDLQAIGR